MTLLGLVLFLAVEWLATAVATTIGGAGAFGSSDVFRILLPGVFVFAVVLQIAYGLRTYTRDAKTLQSFIETVLIAAPNRVG